MSQKVIDEGISNWPTQPTHLIGSTCADCRETVFPAQEYCPKCSGPNMADVLLPRTGTVIAWTTQGFYPGPGYLETPEQFRPFVMALVQLDDVLKVESRLTEPDPAKVAIGMKVELAMVPLATDADGNETLTFAFSPA